jgi:hypothetical protein
MTDRPKIISAIADVIFHRALDRNELERTGFFMLMKPVKCFCWNPNYTTPRKIVKNDLGIFSMMVEKELELD